MNYTVPLKSKLTLETRTSRLDPRASMLETFEDRVSSLESRGSRNKAFSNMQKLKRVSRKRFISRRKNNTVLLTPKVQTFRVDRYRMKTFDHDSGLNVILFGDNLCSKLNVELQPTMETYW